MKQALMTILTATTIASAGRADVEGDARVRAAQQFRNKGEAVEATPDGTFFCEAEEFKVVESPAGWKAGYWGQNYYAATFANCFLSRKGFLGAPEQCDPASTAAITLNVKEPGPYLVLVRYEAAYRFETQFKVKVEQNGKTILDRLYGARQNPKIWAFGSRIKDEVAWPWGAVENIVWEGHDAFADLQPGKATITLTAGPQPAPQARRHVDLVMLTRDVAQVTNRIAKEAYLPLDGMLTQAGDVFIKVSNSGTNRVTVKSLPMTQHSPYWVHMRTWKPVTTNVAPGATSDWVDVGGTMDTLNDGQWGFNASAPCKIEFGVKDAAGAIKPVRTFDANGNLPLISLADARYSARLTTPDEATRELFDYMKSLPAHGKKITQTRVDGGGGLPKEFYDFYGLNGALNGADVMITCRDTPEQIRVKYGKMSEAERNKILIVSLGDEIGLPEPAGPTANDGFVAYLKAQGVDAKLVDPDSGGDWSKVAYPANLRKPDVSNALKAEKPGLYYWAHRYLYHYGIVAIRESTDALRPLLPNAHIGANFSPHHGGGEYTFLGESFKWVTCFREGGMTLPWSEDYIWQVPVGTPQMNGINLDLFRAGLRGKPERRIMYYVMPHFPGNIPPMWRRLWHNAIGHGATILNLFEFDPIWVAYTENHVTSKAMYAEVLRAMRELGLYEDIVQSGARRPAEAGLWFSETADIWRDNTPSFGAAKRSLYVSILHQQLPLDFLVEQDAADGTLASYKVIYLADRHVSRAASAKLAAWVNAGGTLFATAGAGLFDEVNQPNQTLRALLGVEPADLEMPADQQVAFIKQDIRFVKPLDEVKLVDAVSPFPVFGVVSRFKAAADATVRGTFRDGSPAVTVRAAGKGQAFACAFLPGLSYFFPAIPLKPLDRGSTENAMSHFLPVALDVNVGKLVGSPAATVVRPVVASEPLVECSLIESKKGTAVILANWSGKPLKGLTLAFSIPVPGGSATLAGGGPVKRETAGDRTVFTLDLDVADTLILRNP
jgi:hypothetical protein